MVKPLHGARWLNPPHPSTIPTWDLALVLKALTCSPFKPVKSASLKVLTFKTALLPTLVSVKQVNDIQALLVSESCMDFGPDDRVVLKPREVVLLRCSQLRSEPRL